MIPPGKDPWRLRYPVALLAASFAPATSEKSPEQHLEALPIPQGVSTERLDSARGTPSLFVCSKFGRCCSLSRGRSSPGKAPMPSKWNFRRERQWARPEGGRQELRQPCAPSHQCCWVPGADSCPWGRGTKWRLSTAQARSWAPPGGQSSSRVLEGQSCGSHRSSGRSSGRRQWSWNPARITSTKQGRLSVAFVDSSRHPGSGDRWNGLWWVFQDLQGMWFWQTLSCITSNVIFGVNIRARMQGNLWGSERSHILEECSDRFRAGQWTAIPLSGHG